MLSGITLDFESADRITVLNLENQLRYLEESVRGYDEEGKWMHADDYAESVSLLIPALKTIIRYYGGTL